MPKAKKTNDFELPPKGQKAAICISSIDLGTHSSEYKGKIKERRIVRLIWAFIEADKTYTVSRDFTLSNSPKSTLRKTIEVWLSRPYTKEEEGGFETSTLLGKTALISIVHKPVEDNTYANIDNIAPLPEAMKAPEIKSENIDFDLDRFDKNVFDSLPVYVQNKIEESEEYKDILSTQNADRNAMEINEAFQGKIISNSPPTEEQEQLQPEPQPVGT